MKAMIHLATSVAAAGLLAAPWSASAQDAVAQSVKSSAPAATPDDRNFGVGDIVVTAQRRSENLQDVPIAVSAVSAGTLRSVGVTGLSNINVAVPSLSVQSANGYLALHIRGIGSIANGPGFENPVALYVDGVYYGNQSVGLVQFNNIERIEVLKGPQGTLFGRNATGGLAQIITRDPGQTAEASGSLSYGNYNAVEGQLYLAGPLSTDLAADVAVRFSRHDGYGTNLFNGRDVYASKHDVAVRSKIVWTPGDLKFTLIGDYSDRLDSSNALTDVAGSLTLPGLPRVSYPNAWDANTNTQPRLATKGGGVSLKVEGNLGAISVSNLAAYREGTFDNNFDYDGSPLPITAAHIQQKDWQISDELQFSSASDGPLTWVAGAFYYRARGIARPIAITFPDDPAINPAYPVGTIAIYGLQDTTSLSGYAQAMLKITDTLGLTGGARYSWEKRELDARQDGITLLPGNPVVPVTPRTQKEVSFKRPTFRASLDYKPTDDVLFYASFNTGFKSGGFNVTTPTDPYYKPEKLTAYEVGEKAELFDRKVRLNSALFYYDYKDLQVQVAQAAGTGFTNGANAEIYGFESELTIFPTRELQLNAGLTLLHAKYKNFADAPTGVPGGGFPVGRSDASGNDLPFAPNTVFNLGATYTIPLGDNALVANGTWLHSSSFYHEADNVVQDPAYDRFNATLTYKINDGKYTITAFGSNLGNAKVRSVVLTIPSGQQIQLLQDPRTYGIRFGFNF